MELEHTNLGEHCEFSGCNQRDFLPFVCDTCHRKLCLSHRGYAAHECNGFQAKDMTSIDCPICNKSVKFSKADNVDAIWEQHYTTDCTKEAPPKSSVQQQQRCYRSSCRATLGLSNTFTCPKCRQLVCLSHRAPEEHGCLGTRGAVLSRLPPSVAVKPKPTPPAKASTGVSSTGNNSRENPSSSSSSAARQQVPGRPIQSSDSSRKMSVPTQSQRAQATAATVETVAICPFCGVSERDAASLQSHIAIHHPEPGDGTQASRSQEQQQQQRQRSIDPTPVGASGREVCPICQARFFDPVDLVTHFTSHEGTGAPGNSDNNNSGSSGNSSGGIGSGGCLVN